jgi:O-antigen ligase
MTSPALAHDTALVTLDRGADRSGPVISLTSAQRTVLVLVLAAIVTAVAAPYPLTKYILGGTLALYWARLLFNFDERFVGLFVLLLPTFVLAPLEALGIPALNWQTVFLIIFVAAAACMPSPHARLAVSGWVMYFSVVLVLAAVHAWLSQPQAAWPLLVVVKNWLFPFSLFFLGLRLIKTVRQLWFVVACVAFVSLGLALHGLRDGVTTGNLLTNRPTGLMTGQANLFAGYLAMHALLFLFVSRAPELRRVDRLFLIATAFAMVATLVFTLSRGAWMAFAVTAALVGLATNRRLVVLLIVAFLVAYRWAPQEAGERVDMTVQGVEQSDGSTLEESVDDSAALRIIQWKSFPQMLLESPVWGTGLGTYAAQLGRETGIFRAPHATMVQIGTEMGILGLVGYVGLLGAVTTVCVRRSRAAPRGSFQGALGLGLLAATICLFLLDVTGTRFRAHTVTTYFWLLVGAFLGSTAGATDQRTLAGTRADEAADEAPDEVNEARDHWPVDRRVGSVG